MHTYNSNTLLSQEAEEGEQRIQVQLKLHNEIRSQNKVYKIIYNKNYLFYKYLFTNRIAKKKKKTLLYHITEIPVIFLSHLNSSVLEQVSQANAVIVYIWKSNQQNSR